MADRRTRMVKRQVAARGVSDPAVLASMEAVPRHRFVPRGWRRFAYRDGPLPIGESQTISQPYMVARMAELLEPDDEGRALEVGTGSGYGAAVLSRCFDTVYTVERHRELADSARRTLEECGCDNVRVRTGDGARGWSGAAPFDGIVVTAAAADIPRPLTEQLAPEGRLVLPLGDGRRQILVRIRRREDGSLSQERLSPVRFVPLVAGESDASGGADNGGKGADDEECRAEPPG